MSRVIERFFDHFLSFFRGLKNDKFITFGVLENRVFDHFHKNENINILHFVIIVIMNFFNSVEVNFSIMQCMITSKFELFNYDYIKV